MKKLLAFISAIVLLSACQDVIELNTETYKTTLVIDGRITDTLGTSVKLSTTANYFEQGETPSVNNATVTLYENNVPVAVLEKSTSESGLFTSPFNGEVGNTYFLLIEVANDNATGLGGTTWQTNTQMLHRTFAFDSLSIKYLDENTTPLSINAGQFVLGYFTEPQGVGDFYRLRYWKNDSFITQSLDILTDEFSDGVSFGTYPIPPYVVYGAIDEDKDSITIEVSSISEDYYDYLTLLREQIFQVSSPFSAPPALIQGNVYNANNPQEFGFGYFEASALSRSSIVFNP